MNGSERTYEHMGLCSKIRCPRSPQGELTSFASLPFFKEFLSNWLCRYYSIRFFLNYSKVLSKFA